MTKKMNMMFTTNLGMFKVHHANRDFTNAQSQNRIKRIADSMLSEGLLPHAIAVTSKMYIVDGQHRVEAAKIAGKGIWFFIDETIPNTAKGIFEGAKKYNRDAKIWSKSDYVTGLAKMGYESYQNLIDFRKKFPMFSQTEAEMFLANSGTKSVGRAAFADGKFEVKNVKKAEEMANNILKLAPFFKDYNSSVFVRTMITIMEKKPEFDFDRFLHKVNLRPSMLKRQGDKESYKLLIEDIYNFSAKNSDRLNLRF